MIGNLELKAALNVSSITNLLSTYGTGKALFGESQLPADLSATATSINFYPSGAFFGALDYGQYSFYVNCRSNEYVNSRNLAEAVQTEINRKSYSDYFIIADILQTINPMDDTDNYNTPLSVILKKR